MTEQPQPNIRVLRKLLIAAFDTDDLRALVSHDPKLGDLAHEFAPAHPISVMAQETVDWCHRHDHIPYLIQRIKEENPEKYKHFAPDLFASAPTILSARLALPADLPDFTGREADIKKVRDQLNQQGIATIHGMGGIGKTALAVHVAHQLIAQGRFPDAQLYIDLKGTDPAPVDPADALDSLLNAIVEPDPNRPRDLDTLSALWRQAIRGKDAILILDNAADAVQVRPLLPGCPTCAVLVTSRLRFTLPGARRLDLRSMQPGDARDLLQELAPHLDDDGANKVADLCGRLPQALRVAGNYLKLNDDVTAEAYAEMLAGERTRLAQLRDPDDPALDVYATISLSVAQLDEDPRRAWALLSLFPAPFDLPAAAALWDQPEDQARTQLQALRNRSLVTYDPDSTRHHQHDLVRLVAAEDLDTWQEQEVEAAHLHLARHYERVANAAGDLYLEGGDNALQGLALFDLEWPHIQAGQAWAAAHAESDDEAARLCSAYPNAAAGILPLRLPPRDEIVWIEPALQAARRMGDQRAESYHLGNLGVAYQAIGVWDRAIEFYEKDLAISEQLADMRGMAATYNNLGTVYADKGERDRAIEYYEQALETFEQLGDIHGMASTYSNLGIIYRNKGEYDRAIELYEQALETYEQVGDIHAMAQTTNNLAIVYAGKGEFDQAIEFYEQSLEIDERVGNIHGMAETTSNLGSVYADKGEWDRAIEFYEQALEILEQVGDPQGRAYALWGLGDCHEHFEEIQHAREKYRESLALLETIGDPEAERLRRLLAELDD